MTEQLNSYCPRCGQYYLLEAPRCPGCNLLLNEKLVENDSFVSSRTVSPVSDNKSSRAQGVNQAGLTDLPIFSGPGERVYRENSEKGLTASIYLSRGTLLYGKYLIQSVLGRGGFGITYLGWDTNLDIKLAVKEYFPQGLVSRIPGQSRVVSCTGHEGSQFQFGLDRFLTEAKTLAQFENHPNIVTVRDFFQENGTAYMIMSYVEGLTLEEYRQKEGGRIAVNRTMDIMMQVMDALREVHDVGVLHRDVSPDNILIDSKGRIILIDFGAARQETCEHSKSFSVVLKAGYAPEEQYRSRGEQGPWTDVYAVAATFYRAITGETLPEAMDRMAEDTLVPPSSLGISIEEPLERVLLKGLALRAADRCRTMEEFQSALLDSAVENTYHQQNGVQAEKMEMQKDDEDKLVYKIEGKEEGKAEGKAEDCDNAGEVIKKSREDEKRDYQAGRDAKGKDRLQALKGPARGSMPAGEKHSRGKAAQPKNLQGPGSRVAVNPGCVSEPAVALNQGKITGIEVSAYRPVNEAGVLRETGRSEGGAGRGLILNKAVGFVFLALLFIILLLGGSYIHVNMLSPAIDYNRALVLMETGNFEAAESLILNLGDYRDALEIKIENRYRHALDLLDKGEYEDAGDLLIRLGEYKDAGSKLASVARALYDRNRITPAVKAWHYAGDYREVQNILGRYQHIISAGGFHTVGLNSDGTVIYAGPGSERQSIIAGWEGISALSAGHDHTVGLNEEGTLTAAGNNDFGQCNVSGWTEIVAVAAGGYHTAGLVRDGTVLATGENEKGQCETGDWTGVVAVSAGKYHTVGLRPDGTALAAGSNARGQCNVLGWDNLVAIAAGYYHTAGLRKDGTVVFSGDSGQGRAGIEDWAEIVALSAGGYHTVGLKADGTVLAAGSDVKGQCRVSDWEDIVAVSAGGYHTLGMKSDGTIHAVGDNEHGQRMIFKLVLKLRE